MAKILVIDDSLFQRRTIRNRLKPAGYDIQEATTGRQGLEMLTTFAPDCIVVDILMPEIDGVAFLKTLQVQGNPTPVIVLTADIQETTRQECLDLGAKAIIHKPLTRAEAVKLQIIINTLLVAKKEARS